MKCSNCSKKVILTWKKQGFRCLLRGKKLSKEEEKSELVQWIKKKIRNFENCQKTDFLI